MRKFVVVIGGLALVAGACGGGHPSPKNAARHATTSTAPGDTTTTGPGNATSTTRRGDTTTTVHGATATTAHGSSGGATTTVNTNAAPAPATPGTYDYAQSGSTSQGDVPAQGTLVVSGSGP